MVVTMRAAPGVGLAAPQIGVGLRVIVLEDGDTLMSRLKPADRALRERTPFPLTVIVNPVLERGAGDERATFFEGCLSVPGYRMALVERDLAVTVTGLDGEGAPLRWEARGWPARILQHEVDHLNGTLYVDRMLSRTFGANEEVVASSVAFGLAGRGSAKARRIAPLVRAPDRSNPRGNADRTRGLGGRDSDEGAVAVNGPTKGSARSTLSSQHSAKYHREKNRPGHSRLPLHDAPRRGDDAEMLHLFEVHVAPGSDPGELISEETKEETNAQVMTADEAAKVGFAGIPAPAGDVEVRFIAVRARDSRWIQRALEANNAVARFKIHEIDG